MFLTSLLNLIVSLLGSLILYFIGKILSKPSQIRSFFGFKKEGEVEADHANINIWLENIGLVVQVLAICSAIASVFILISF